MQTQLLLENKTYVQIPYLRYIVIILLVGLFSFWAFPGQSGTGQTEYVVNHEGYADFLDEEEIQHLKEHQMQNQNRLTLPSPVFSSKFIRQASKDVKKVAITFDDGPHFLTGKYIDILQTYDIMATFFLIGIQVEKYPNEAKKIIDEGYEIGSHSYNHKQLSKMSADSIENDFQKSLATIISIAKTDIRFFRPPFGDFNDTVIQTAKNHNLVTILWCVDPRDWQKDNPEQIAQHVIENAENGAIILLHEGRESTLKALPQIIEGLWEKGFEIVSLSELLSTVH